MMRRHISIMEPKEFNMKSKQKNNIYRNRYAHTSSRYRSFLKMMFKWNGAVFKLIWHDLLLFLVVFFAIDFIYIYWLKRDPEAVKYKELFELACIYCGRYLHVYYLLLIFSLWIESVTEYVWIKRP